jgi:hypothetical protein
MYQILTSKPLYNFYLLSFLLILLHFIMRFSIGAGSRPSESTYNKVVFFYGHYFGNVMFLFPLFFWYKFNFWVALISLLFIIICFFLVPIILIKVSKSKSISTLLQLMVFMSFFLIPFLIYFILSYDYSRIPV